MIPRIEHGQPGPPIRVAHDPGLGIRQAQCMASRVHTSTRGSYDLETPIYVVGYLVGPEYQPCDSICVFEGPECSMTTVDTSGRVEDGAVEPYAAIIFNHRGKQHLGQVEGGGSGKRKPDDKSRDLLVWGPHVETSEPEPAPIKPGKRR